MARRLGQGSASERWNAFLEFLLKYQQQNGRGQAPEPPAVGQINGYNMQMIYCPKCASEDIDIKRKSSEEYLSEGISFNNIFEIVLIVLMGIEVIAYIPELVFGSWVFITMWKSADIFSKISLSMIYALMGVFLGASFLFIIKYMRIILLKIHINHIRSEFPDNIYVCKNCLFTWQ